MGGHSSFASSIEEELRLSDHLPGDLPVCHVLLSFQVTMKHQIVGFLHHTRGRNPLDNTSVLLEDLVKLAITVSC